MFLGIFLAMFAAGLLLGFVGAGGSGFIISILTTIFGLPLHTALGTALSAMIFSSVSGTISHYREGNIVLRNGLVVGVFGACGAWICSRISVGIDEGALQYMTAAVLYLSSGLLWLRMYAVGRMKAEAPLPGETAAAGEGRRPLPWLKGGVIGLACGALSGLFGVGATPFIQLSLMAFMKMKVSQAAGTTMLVIVPIAVAGGAGFYGSGHLDLKLLAVVLAAITAGSYIGAKFTKRLPSAMLKVSMVTIPMLGATLLLF
ncbi:sulfite exporter TauE/SafE family protein [Paenibacillus soyae]|uniref:Probable membrane transporter protein n=1 Tax=Paenibacillus soyae TaxID=2969249 RepID=A0A9X2MR42_9BACL|nr:sulfite exporter TauE/SafE family protein [Paenibacillus soyae]MCR2804644.1 sulfite exporter TauE/SafE family protein [Paenibacillus soyae]